MSSKGGNKRKVTSSSSSSSTSKKPRQINESTDEIDGSSAGIPK
jgi:hypothetical protein